ncbi:MAG: hypothetical protein IT585_06585 [candidate division Zixibacteria bacterium]|nr:hypothetical protein [candidate division Zixibacteria bacterium]
MRITIRPALVAVLAAMFVFSTVQTAPAVQSTSTAAGAGDATDAGVLFLGIVNSARAVGMGAATVNLVDEESGLYNPAALGLFHLQRNAGFSAPIATNWLPNVIGGGLNLTTFAVSGGYAVEFGDPDGPNQPRVALALGYSRLKLDYLEGPRGVPGSTGVGEEDFYDKADLFTVAGALEYYARIGLGFTHKRIRSYLGPEGYDIVGKANASDYAVAVELPIVDLVGTTPAPNRAVNYDFTPSFAYVRANNGDDIEYPDAAQEDPLPKLSRTGIALKLGAASGRASIASLLLVHEWQKDLVGSDAATIKKFGAEFGVLGSLFIRGGKYNDDDGQTDTYTYGLGLRAGGIIAWLARRSHIDPNSRLVRWVDSGFDVAFDYGRYDKGSSLISETNFYSLRVSI